MSLYKFHLLPARQLLRVKAELLTSFPFLQCWLRLEDIFAGRLFTEKAMDIKQLYPGIKGIRPKAVKQVIIRNFSDCIIVSLYHALRKQFNLGGYQVA